MPRPVHFEIHAEDCSRAIKFYKDIFGWDIQKWDGPMEYYMVMTGPKDQPGINGGLIKRPCPNPTLGSASNAFVCTVDVSDVDAIEKTILTAGGKIAMPKMEVPGVGWLIYGIDTEGNTFGCMQFAPGAGC